MDIYPDVLIIYTYNNNLISDGKPDSSVGVGYEF